MAVKKFKPTTPSLRYMTVADFSELTKKKPEKALTRSKSSTGGRNNHGHVTSWHRGGGHKRRYRIIDFLRAKHGIPAKVAAIEYDPNRSARIALLHYADGEKRYILAPARVAVGAREVTAARFAVASSPVAGCGEKFVLAVAVDVADLDLVERAVLDVFHLSARPELTGGRSPFPLVSR